LAAQARHALELLAEVAAGALGAFEKLLAATIELVVRLLEAGLDGVAHEVASLDGGLLGPIERPGRRLGGANRFDADRRAALVVLPAAAVGACRVVVVTIAGPGVVAGLESHRVSTRPVLLVGRSPARIRAQRCHHEHHRYKVHLDVLSKLDF
jgi:hypothetical protein